jgi:hypothetical protein
LPDRGLQGSEPENIFFVVPDYELNGTVAEVADSIK